MGVLITIKEAISLLGCSLSVFKGYLRRGNLQAVQKVGGKSYFYKEKILNFSHQKPLKRNRRHLIFKSRFHSSLEQPALLEIIDKWKVNSQDSGSADVQIGIYTEKIKRQEVEMKKMHLEDPAFKKMRYTLLTYVGERRKLLRYLEISDYARYRRAQNLISEHRVA